VHQERSIGPCNWARSASCVLHA